MTTEPPDRHYRSANHRRALLLLQEALDLHMLLFGQLQGRPPER